MMGIFEIILLSIALAMDCFTVSIASGVLLQKRQWGLILWIATLFGFFQAFMPLIGWVVSARFEQYIEAYDHWVAFALLLFLGIRMIADAFQPAEERHFNPRKLSTQLLLAVATSIDALAVGVSLSVTGYLSVRSLVLPLAVIGAGSFLFSVTGHLLGLRFGKGISHRCRPELFGGIILIFIGVKILLTSLF